MREPALDHLRDRETSAPQRPHELVHVAVAKRLRQLVDRRLRRGRETPAPELPVEHLLPERDGVLVLGDLEPVADLAPGARALHELQPVAVRLPQRRRDDLDGVAAPELEAQRHDPAVHLGPDAVVPHLGVNEIGEVERRRPARQAPEIAARREHEDLVLVERGLEELHELVGIARAGLPLGVPQHGLELGEELGIRTASPFLVAIVRGHAELGGLMHVRRAYLELHHRSAGHDDRGVERLVHVALGSGDVVLEALVDRRVEVVDEPQHPVAIRLVGGDHPHAEEIEDLLEFAAVGRHLSMDRVEVLRPPGDLGPDPELREPALEGPHHLLDHRLPLLALQLHPAAQVVEGPRVEILEAEVLQLPFEPGDPQPVRERRVDLAGLARDAGDPDRIEGRQSPHVVEAVGELDQDDAEILRHREQHLPEILGLLPFRPVEMKSADLGHAVHQERDLRPELGLNRREIDLRVLDDVVEKRRDEDGLVGARAQELGQDHGDRDAVRHVGLAGQAKLRSVRVRGKLERREEARAIPPWFGPLEGLEQRSQDLGGDRGHGQRI